MSLNTIIKELEKKYGEGILLKCSDDYKKEVEVISTRSISLDRATGIGGIPIGRIIEIYGPESSGKTTLALTIIAEAQKKGMQCVYIDAEHSVDLEYAKKLGVQIKDLYLSQPNSGEQALDLVEKLVISKEVRVIVVDSVAALVPQAEIDGEMGQSHIGLQARLMSQALRKLTAITDNANTTIIFINQIRMNINTRWGGNPEVTTGGTALKYYSSMRIEIRKAAKLEKNDEIIGNRVKIKIVKNKLAAPFKTTELDILYNKGISLETDAINLALQKEIIKREGLTFLYKNIKLGRSLETSREFLESNQELLKELIKDIKDSFSTKETKKLTKNIENIDMQKT